jgi:hypothetical protein
LLRFARNIRFLIGHGLGVQADAGPDPWSLIPALSFDLFPHYVFRESPTSSTMLFTSIPNSYALLSSRIWVMQL